MQAVHDFLEFGTDLKAFDHWLFPGVVPRTFFGAIVLSVLSFPFHALFKTLAIRKFYSQIAVRCILGVLSWLSYICFRNGIKHKFGIRASRFTLILTSLQFHICFYMSRTLPNTFALLFCLVSYGFWMKGKAKTALLVIGVGMVVFRCDLLVLFAPLTLQMLIFKEVEFFITLLQGIGVVSVALAIAIPIDSFLWDRIVWPEGVVLFFNTVQNKSSEWGVHPFHWYFTNALLKSLNVSIVWILCGVLGFQYPSSVALKMESERTDSSLKSILSVANRTSSEIFFRKGIDLVILYYIFPAIAFVVLYSILPHKELRFVFPALPLLTIAGGVGLDNILPPAHACIYPLSLIDNKDEYDVEDVSENEKSSRTTKRGLSQRWFDIFFSSAVVLSLLAMIAISSTLSNISHHNYPGGKALQRLLTQHIPTELSHAEEFLDNYYNKPKSVSSSFMPVLVHIDGAAAMTGVTRFIQEQITYESWKNNYPQFHHHGEHPSVSVSSAAQQAAFHRGLYLHKPSGLEELKSELDRFFTCSYRNNYCERSTDLVYFSKEEFEEDYHQYDWLITEDPSAFISDGTFVIAEEIKGYHGVRLTLTGPIIEVRTLMYILFNHGKHGN